VGIRQDTGVSTVGIWGAFMRDRSQVFGKEPVIVGDRTILRTLQAPQR